MNVVKKLHGSVRFPTSIIVKGANVLGVEIARSLLEQGGYVIIIDSESNASRKLLDPLVKYKNLTVLNFSAINTLGLDLRRLDYVFYFEHKSTHLKKKSLLKNIFKIQTIWIQFWIYAQNLIRNFC